MSLDAVLIGLACLIGLAIGFTCGFAVGREWDGGDQEQLPGA